MGRYRDISLRPRANCPVQAFAIGRKRSAHSHTCRLPPWRVFGQRLEEPQVRRSGRAEVTDIRVIRTFLEILPLHKLRDKDIHVRVPFAVGVRRQVQRHVVDENGKICARSRLNPRRKYWLALPPPACCVMIRPGSASRTSPQRRIGRSASSVSPRSLCRGSGDSDQIVFPSPLG